MALSTVYRVITRYETDTGRAESKMARLSSRTNRLGRQMDRLKAKMATVFSFFARVGVGAATIGMGFILRLATRLNKELEETKISIASAFQFQGLGTFSNNLIRAEGLIKKFRKAAITSPGESRDLASITRATSPVLAQVNATDDEIVKFATRGLGAAFSQLGGDIKLAEQQLLQILQGRGGSDLALFNIVKIPLAKTLGIEGTAEALNNLAKTDPRTFFLGLTKTLKTFDDANVAFSKSFLGLWSSINEVLNNALLAGAEPLFNFMKTEMQTVLKWTEKNHDRMQQFAVVVGEKLTVAFKLAASAVKLVANNLLEVVALLSLVAARSAGGALASAFAPGGVGRSAGSFLSKNVASGLAVGRRVTGAGKSAVGFGGDALGEALFGKIIGRGKSRGSRFAQSLQSAPGRLRAAGRRQINGEGVNFGTLSAGARKLGSGAKGLLAGGGKGILSALGTGLNGLLTVAGPLAVVIAMVAGAFRVMRDVGNEATIFLKTSFDELVQALDVVAMQFGGGGGFVTAITDLVDWLGTGVVGILGLTVKAVERVVTAFSFMIAVFKGFAIGIGTIITQVQAGGFSALKNAPLILDESIREQLTERERLQRLALANRRKKQKEEADAKLQKQKNNTPKKPSINITIIQEIKTDANPDRIAFATRDILQKSLANRRTAFAFGEG